MTKVALCLPARNAAAVAGPFLGGLAIQTLTGFDRLLIDSESADATSELFAAAGFHVHAIPAAAFNHGTTRQLAVELLPEADIIVFMTQDAVLADPGALQALVGCFADPSVGAAYGRQLPAPDATPLAAHARLFNYPPSASVRDHNDIRRYGVKTAFLSNSFAAYRRSALMAVGGFPAGTILGEDTLVAARMLLGGWRIAYCARATCYHSHNYRLCMEFRRYFDIGVLHAREAWYLQALGEVAGEGGRFVRSELGYLCRHAPALIPLALARSAAKIIGYRLGRQERLLPLRLKRLLGWNRKAL